MTERRGRARLGLLVPFTNTNFEPDMGLMAPQDVICLSARMGGYEAEAIPDAAQMQGLGTSDLTEPLRLLAGAKPDMVLYGCTSATLTHGPAFDADLAGQIKRQSGAACVTAAGALIAALRALGASRISFAAPYVSQINAQAVAFLAGHGIETVRQAAVSETLDNDGQGAMTPEEVVALARRAMHPQAEALVLSCTDMRAAEVIAVLEAETGCPVVTSNQALLFAALSTLGLPDRIAGFGRLLEARPDVV